MAFVIKDGKVAPNDCALPEGVSPRLVELWDKAMMIQKLMPHPIATHMVGILSVLNATAAGGDVESGARELAEIEQRILHDQKELRGTIAKSDRSEVLLTALLGGIILIIYCSLRRADFVAVAGEDNQYILNVIQNSVGATGWAMVGFAPGLYVRRIYEMRTAPFGTVAERHARGTCPWHAALGNLLLAVILFGSIYVGVSFVKSGTVGWPNIEVPVSAFWPGVILGLTATRLAKAAMG